MNVAPRHLLHTLTPAIIAAALGLSFPYLGPASSSKELAHIRAFDSTWLGLALGLMVLGSLAMWEKMKDDLLPALRSPRTRLFVIFTIFDGIEILFVVAFMVIAVFIAPIGLVMALPRLALDLVLTPLAFIPPFTSWLAEQALPATAERARDEAVAGSRPQPTPTLLCVFLGALAGLVGSLVATSTHNERAGLLAHGISQAMLVEASIALGLIGGFIVAARLGRARKAQA